MRGSVLVTKRRPLSPLVLLNLGWSLRTLLNRSDKPSPHVHTPISAKDFRKIAVDQNIRGVALRPLPHCQLTTASLTSAPVSEDSTTPSKCFELLFLFWKAYLGGRKRRRLDYYQNILTLRILLLIADKRGPVYRSESIKMEASTLQLIAKEKHALLHAAQEARKLSYSPYSKFRVGAALLTKWGEIILGANFENASYGGTVCAERTALGKALMRSTELDVPEKASGRRIQRGDIIAIAVASDLEGSCSPCGICRQVIRELCSLQTRILMVGCNWSKDNSKSQSTDIQDQGGKELNEPNVEVVTLEYLLPMSFGPEDLEKPRHS